MRERFFEIITKISTRYLSWTLIAISISIVIAALVASRLEIRNRWSDLLPINDPTVQEFNRILEGYSSASSIILVVRGKKPERMRQFVERIRGPIDAIEGIRYVNYRIDTEFIKSHGLMLTDIRDLEDSKDLFSNVNLLPLFTHINDLLEKTYTQTEEERLTNKEEEDRAIVSLEGMRFWLLTIRDYLGGKNGNVSIEEAVDRLILGEPYYFSYNRRFLLVFIQPNFPVTDYEPSVKTIKEIRTVLDRAREKFPDITAGLTGGIAMTVDEYNAIMGSMWWITALAFVLIIVIFIFAFKMLVAPLLAGIVLLTGVLWTGGFAKLTVGSLNIMTYMFAVILFGLGVDFSIHIITGFIESRGKGLSIEEALHRGLNKVGAGVLTGSLTTSLAFFTLMISENRGMKEFGLILGVGVIFCMLASFLVLPPLLVLREKRLEKRKKHRTFSYEFNRLGEFADRYSRAKWIAILGVTGITVFLLYEAKQLKFDYNMLNIEPKGMESVVFNDTIIKHFDLSPDYALVTTQSLDSARAIVKQAKKYDVIAGVESITDFLPSLEEQRKKAVIINRIRYNLLLNDRVRTISKGDYEKIIEELKRLWMNITELSSIAFQGGKDRLEEKCYELVANPEDATSEDLIENTIELLQRDSVYSIEVLNEFQRDYFRYFRNTLLRMANTDIITLNSLPQDIRERYESKDRKNFLISIFPRKYIWDINSLRSFTKIVKRVNPKVTGTPPMFLSLIDYITRDGKRASLLALVSVFLLLMFDFRSFRYTLYALIPLIAGGIWMMGIMKLSGILLDVMNVTALPLIIGIGIDDGVHIIHRYRKESEGGIKTVFSTTGKAILLTSVTTMMSFGSLIFNIHRGMASMGLVLFIGIGTCFLTTVLFLAPILRRK